MFDPPPYSLVFTQNYQILEKEIPDNITYLYLHGTDYVNPPKWPSKLIFLETHFRPDISSLPSSLKILSIISQNEIIKKDLPSALEILVVRCPESKPRFFYPKKDHFDLYRINIKKFQYHNYYSGSYFYREKLNIKYFWISYRWNVEGDSYQNNIIYQTNENIDLFLTKKVKTLKNQ